LAWIAASARVAPFGVRIGVDAALGSGAAAGVISTDGAGRDAVTRADAAAATDASGRVPCRTSPDEDDERRERGDTENREEKAPAHRSTNAASYRLPSHDWTPTTKVPVPRPLVERFVGPLPGRGVVMERAARITGGPRVRVDGLRAESPRRRG
jgi:hypothetical protein